MNIPLRAIRRATLDDLQALIPLWQLEQLPVLELEKRFKEFQVVEGEDGSLIGIVGVQVLGMEARLHSEVFSPFEYADTLREKLWERIQVMGENQGWVRVWTQFHADAWRACGFDPASSEQLTKLPDAFAHSGSATWRVIQLKTERQGGATLDAEFEMLRLTYQSENQQMMKRAKALRIFAMILAATVAVWVGLWGYKLFQNRDQLKRR